MSVEKRLNGVASVFYRASRLIQQIFPFHTLNKDLKIYFISNLFASFGDGLTIYLLPNFIRDLSATPEDVGFLFSILTIASALTIIPGGFLADKYDLKKILLLGWAIWVPVPLSFAFGTHWTQLIPAMFLYGVLISGPAGSAYVVGRSEKSTMTSTFAMLASAWGAGYMFAPAVSGYLAETVGMQFVFFLTAIFYFVTLATLTRLSSHRATQASSGFPLKHVEPGDISSVFKRSRIFLLSALFAAVMFSLALVYSLQPQFLKDVYLYDLTRIGVLGSFTYFGGFIFSLILGIVGDRHGKTTAISAAMLGVASSLGLFVCFDNFAILILASFLRGASFPMWAFIGASVGAIAPSATRARWISVVQTTAQLASILAPYVGGVLYAGSPRTPFLIAIAIMLLIAFVAQTKFLKE